MSRARNLTTTLAAVLAAVLSFGMLSGPFGTTHALWQQQVTLDGITVVAGESEPPPAEFACPRWPDEGVQLHSGEHLYFECDLVLRPESLPLPAVIDFSYQWGAVEGNSAFISTMSTFEILGFEAPDSIQADGNHGGSRTHMLYRARDGWPPNAPSISATPIPDGTEEMIVRMRIHAHSGWVEEGLAVHGGTMSAAVYPLGGDPTRPAVEAHGPLPRIWGGAVNPFSGAQASPTQGSSAPQMPSESSARNLNQGPTWATDSAAATSDAPASGAESTPDPALGTDLQPTGPEVSTADEEPSPQEAEHPSTHGSSQAVEPEPSQGAESESSVEVELESHAEQEECPALALDTAEPTASDAVAETEAEPDVTPSEDSQAADVHEHSEECPEHPANAEGEPTDADAADDTAPCPVCDPQDQQPGVQPDTGPSTSGRRTRKPDDPDPDEESS